ncbi:TIGR02281 family clan AA aspartic protease [Rhizobium sp. DKSPLA3]|uniref:TIGR02281 family clan AA aspartic protease n=1 Tax=Rhizobium quercicola TaxID=2901226 RepID=A0A9X1NTL6_9HYPH|nr:TIGR02281 family clan AA aspartic protease [Rhizobium quercicola]MCD7110198.1 TIGR02281 family clan AA aspartic protease [Rhizobium quercicola]
MMSRVLMIAGLAGLCAYTLPTLTGRYLDRTPARTSALPAKPAAADPAMRAAAGAREVVLPAGPGGHFSTTLDINGRSVRGLIDTGATVVALNESTARRIGLSLSTLDYSISVSTANGLAKAASVTLKRIKVGNIAVENVAAMVLPDTALSDTLVGMSFLNRLSSFAVEDGALRLRR